MDRFRDLCRRQGRQYTKVLERLAEVYLETDGAVLDGTASAGPADPDKKKRLVQVESLQNKLLEDLLMPLLNPLIRNGGWEKWVIPYVGGQLLIG